MTSSTSNTTANSKIPGIKDISARVQRVIRETDNPNHKIELSQVVVDLALVQAAEIEINARVARLQKALNIAYKGLKNLTDDSLKQDKLDKVNGL